MNTRRDTVKAWISDWIYTRAVLRLNSPTGLTHSSTLKHHFDLNCLHDVKLPDTLTPVLVPRVAGSARHKRRDKRFLKIAKTRLAAEQVWTQRVFVELCRPGGSIRKEKPARPFTAALLGPHSLKVELLVDSCSSLVWDSTAAARFRKVTSLPCSSRDRGERALLCSLLYPPFMLWLKGHFSQNPTGGVHIWEHLDPRPQAVTRFHALNFCFSY